jgi:hypothetical protein
MIASGEVVAVVPGTARTQVSGTVSKLDKTIEAVWMPSRGDRSHARKFAQLKRTESSEP